MKPGSMDAILMSLYTIVTSEPPNDNKAPRILPLPEEMYWFNRSRMNDLRGVTRCEINSRVTVE